MTRRVVTPYTSEVGEGSVDWAKFCWDGSQIYRDTCSHGYTEEHKAPLPYVDKGYPALRYLHVPWNWEEDMTIFRIYPRYEVGDRLWVKEAYLKDIVTGEVWDYMAGRTNKHPYEGLKYVPSIFMPRRASRIALEITKVRVERLQEVTAGDCTKEGIPYEDGDYITMRVFDKFHSLWDSLNAKRGYGWNFNPWVWVISFKRVNG